MACSGGTCWFSRILQGSGAAAAAAGRRGGGWRWGPGWGCHVKVSRPGLDRHSPILQHFFGTLTDENHQETKGQANPHAFLISRRAWPPQGARSWADPPFALSPLETESIPPTPATSASPKCSHSCRSPALPALPSAQSHPTAALPAWDLSSLYSTFYNSFDRPWIVTMRRQGQPSSAPSGAVQLHGCFFSSCQLVLTLCLFSPPSGGILLVEATLLTFKWSGERCWAALSSSSTGAVLPAFSLTVSHHSSPGSSACTVTQMLLTSLPLLPYPKSFFFPLFSLSFLGLYKLWQGSHDSLLL